MPNCGQKTTWKELIFLFEIDYQPPSTVSISSDIYFIKTQLF